MPYYSTKSFLVFLKTINSGQIDLLLSAPNDIDFIIYGPFASHADILNNCGNLGRVNSPIVDCSYSGTNNEPPSITANASGEYYLLLVTNYSNSVQDISLTQSSGSGGLDCSMYSDFGYKSITGNIFFDQNQNGLQDNQEVPIPYFNYSISPTNYLGFSSPTGSINYNIQTLDTIDFEVESINEGWVATTNNPYNFTLDTVNTIMDTLFFGFYPDSIYPNGQINFINYGTQCITNSQSWINIYNSGTDTINGEFSITLPEELELTFSSLPYDSIVDNIVYYSFDSLNIFENINISFITAPIVTGSITIGDTLLFSSNLNIFDIDNIYSHSTQDSLSSIVNCSYDPNNKLSLTNGIQTTNYIQPHDYLEYIINFQNTGTAEPVNITLEDTLSNNLDLSSFIFQSSSHSPSASIDENRVLTFQFDNILLPDSNTNELLSHGYVKYLIKLTPGLLPNVAIENTASIYFDFNEAIVTNTTLNTIDCYILPDNPNFSITDNVIYSNLSDPNLNFIWLFEGDTLESESNSFIEGDNEGIYTLITSNEYDCTLTSEYNLSLGGFEKSHVNLLIYPTVFNSSLNIQLSEGQIKTILIYDHQGKLVKSIKNIDGSSVQITNELNDLSKGNYLIKVVNSNGESVTKKIIK